MRCTLAVLLALLLPSAASAATTYRNPLPITGAPGGDVETFADPAVIRTADGYRAYATSDPLNGRDRGASGTLRIRRIPFARSTDLVHWTYAGEALAAL
ncbi:MAG: arabinan endo,5-alpha-L-arabinosidase, partial [Solirubrobacteraceae bacterium]|nr:arabinan endo,5-alpha-L-arabinosidase [Solirubrobacteraceae bacterium]